MVSPKYQIYIYIYIIIGRTSKRLVSQAYSSCSANRGREYTNHGNSPTNHVRILGTDTEQQKGEGSMAALKTDRIAFSSSTCESQPGNPPFHLLILHHEPKRDRGPQGHEAAQSQRGSMGGAESLWKGNHLAPRSSQAALCNSLKLTQQMQGHSLEAGSLNSLCSFDLVCPTSPTT